jgi:signal transduction histidine kinase/putative methionine-R-sulfoxide reductase with GAF domain
MGVDVAADESARASFLPLWRFLRENKEAILADWEDLARQRPPAMDQSRRALRDHLPALIDAIADAAESRPGSSAASVSGSIPDVHAIARLDEGYDLPDVAEEYALLRACILRRLALSGAQLPPAELVAVELLNRTIDDAVIRAVTRYHQARSRSLAALERLSQEALAAWPEETGFLERLLAVLVETTEAIDEATILLRDGDHLRAAASAGLQQRLPKAWSIRIGEGFAGRIAETRQPASIAGDEIQSNVLDETLRQGAFRAIHGTPLLYGDELLGVVHIGSRTASEFSADDRQLLKIMATRAAVLIAQNRLRLALATSEARLQSIVDHAPIWLSVKEGPELRYSIVNRRFAETLVTTPEAVRGKTDAELLAHMPEDVRRSVLESDQRVLRTGEPMESEDTLWIGDQRRTFHTHKFPMLNEHGEPYAVGSISTDATDRRRHDEARERFIGILGHDLRSPLSAIQMAASVLEESDLADGDKRLATRILDSTHRMGRMIAEVLDFARARLGSGIPIERVRTDLRELAKNVVGELKLAHPDASISIRDDGDLIGEWDRERIGQVISNLVGNAIAHGEGPVVVLLRDASERVHIEVLNRGEPIPADAIPTLFEPFRQAEPDRTRAKRGLGLGLFIVREIVVAHGGQVRVQSNEESGTKFEVVLPRGA